MASMMLMLMLMLSPTLVAAQNASMYSLLRLQAPWPSGVGRLSRAAARAINEEPHASTVEFAASPIERRRLEEGGAAFTLVHADASQFFAARAAADTMVEARRLETSGAPALLGSMGGFYTPAEVQAEMRRLAEMYPTYVSPAKVITHSNDGLPIEFFCVTADLEGCDALSSRPAALYTALVHAREPATVMCIIAFVRSMVEQAAAGHHEAVALLSQRKLLIMPVANPDGYAWNAKTHPRGGGMKRKNGRHTCSRGGADDGVDPNRNFGYKYAFDNLGSSNLGCSEEFRGAGAFSEPETQAIRTVTRKFKPLAILHWHGWGNDLAFPYSYDWRAKLAANELGLFQEFASEMTATNGYAYGRAWESVGYMTNGEADDWGWGEEHAVSLTLEVGSSKDSFWPSPSRVGPIAAETVLSATYLAWAVGPMLQLDAISISDATSGRSGVFSLRLQNNGLGDFVGSHKACIVPPAGVSAELAPGRSGSWKASADVMTLLGSPSQRCFSLPGLPARTHSTLPPIKLEWAGGLKTLDLDLRVEQSAAAGGEVQLVTVAVRVLLSAATLTSCDELCICKSSDLTRFTMSHECRAQLPPGSHCRLAKPSHTGSNWASGVVDEYFAYKATTYASGGVCQMESTHRDTLLGVYKACTRFGAQDPVGFANSEGSSHASVTFPCEAGATYYLFWNAEYVPGRFSFNINERCTGSTCVRAHRHRLLRRAKKRRAKLL